MVVRIVRIIVIGLLLRGEKTENQHSRFPTHILGSDMNQNRIGCQDEKNDRHRFLVERTKHQYS